MCTAAAYMPKDLYFGRTLDYEFSYGETVTVTPRHFPLLFANGACLEEHYATTRRILSERGEMT